MTKQEIIQAISETIVANDEKGITAESLANILLEIVNATPEASAGGTGGGYTLDITLVNPEDFENFVLTDEAKAHNVTVFNSICSVAANLTSSAANPAAPVSFYLDGLWGTSIAVFPPLEEGAPIEIYFMLPQTVPVTNGTVQYINMVDQSTSHDFAPLEIVNLVFELSSDGSITFNMQGLM